MQESKSKKIYIFSKIGRLRKTSKPNIVNTSEATDLDGGVVGIVLKHLRKSPGISQYLKEEPLEEL